MPASLLPWTAQCWTLQGKIKWGRPKETWDRKIESELKDKGLTLSKASRQAWDRIGWRSLAIASAGMEKTERKMNKITTTLHQYVLNSNLWFVFVENASIKNTIPYKTENMGGSAKGEIIPVFPYLRLPMLTHLVLEINSDMIWCLRNDLTSLYQHKLKMSIN